jgi:hypothetical protein
MGQWEKGGAGYERVLQGCYHVVAPTSVGSLFNSQGGKLASGSFSVIRIDGVGLLCEGRARWVRFPQPQDIASSATMYTVDSCSNET